MGNLNFAERYGVEFIDPSPEQVRLRHKGFESALKKLDQNKIYDLTRLYFDLETKKSTDWFKEAFYDYDTSFSMGNKREVAVLAACILVAAVEDGNISAGLAPLTSSAFGCREQFLEKLNIIKDCETALNILSNKVRQFEQVDLTSVDESIQEPVAEEPTEEEPSEINVAIQPLLKRLANLEEEQSILWWCFSGWSKTLAKPFVELKPALIPVVAAYDLASLTKQIPGPNPAPAVLLRLLPSAKKGNKSTKILIADVINASLEISWADLFLKPCLTELADLCPVLTSLRLVKELGNSAPWQEAFKKQVGIDANVSFLPLDLAMQVYREMQLLSLYSD